MGSCNNEKSSIVLSKIEYGILTSVTYDKYYEYQQEQYAHREIYELFRDLHKEFYSVSSKALNFDSIRLVTSKRILKAFLDCIDNENEIEKLKLSNISVAYNLLFDRLYDPSNNITIPTKKLSGADWTKYKYDFINSIKYSCLYNEKYEKNSKELEAYYHLKFLLEASLGNTCEMERTRNNMIIIPIFNGKDMNDYKNINYQKTTIQESSKQFLSITAQREYSTNRLNSEENDDFNYYDYNYNNDYDYNDLDEY